MKIWQKRLIALLAGAGVAAAVYAADIKISALTDGGAAQATDMIPVSRGVLPRRVVLSGYVPATATALAANGANCSSNQSPVGVDASGAAEGCFAPYVPGGTDVAFADGGTGVSSASDDTVLVSSGSAWAAKAVPDCTDTGGNHLNYTASTNAFSCGTSGGSASPTSGTFTASFDNACTTTPTVDFAWRKNGNIVSLRATAASGFSCTSDSTSFLATGAPLPASIRPTGGYLVVNTNGVTITDAGVPGFGCLVLGDDGVVQLQKVVTASAACGAFTGTGSKAWGVNSIQQFTYVIE